MLGDKVVALAPRGGVPALGGVPLLFDPFLPGAVLVFDYRMTIV